MKAHGTVISCFLFFLTTAASSESEEIHRTMDREEIIRYFDVDHHDKVPEYEITVVERHRTRRSASEPHQIYKLAAFQKHFHLHLTPNEHLVSPNLVVETRLKAGDLKLERYNPRGVFYHGHVLDNPGSIVAVRDTYGNGKLSGSIVSDGHLYKIEPFHPRRDTSKKSSEAHIISRRSLQSLRAMNVDPFVQDYIKVSESLKDDESSSRMRKRHARAANGPLSPKYIEIMMTADIFTTEFYGDATKDYMLGLANLVARLYKDPTMKAKVDVSFVVVKLYLINGTEPELDVNKHNVRSALAYMGLFSDFAKKRNPPVGEDTHWDNAVLLSRRICGLASCYLDGLAYYGVPCSSTAGVSINDAHSLGSAFSIAHELAHNFGVDHDSKGCQGGSIMATVQTVGVGAFHWSNCSVAEMESIMRRAKCYDNKPTNFTEIPKVLPGYTWDGTQQCRFMYDKNHTLCWMTTHDCGTLYCTTGNHCYGRGVPPAEGTRCGFRKWCIKGVCVPDGTTDPPPVDGSWGQWTGYTPCSRSCGTGVRHMTRKCNNPAPKYGGKKCEGPSVGMYSTCNRWRCRYRENSPTFRDIQCASKRAYIKPGSPCKVWCLANNVASTANHNVKDGTRCSHDVDDYSVCVGGVCKLVGCDRRYGSEAVRDRCRICGGDGSRCKFVTGKNTNDAGFHEVFHVFPEGATNIYVWEAQATINFINLKRTSDKTFSNLFFHPNGDRVEKAAGTTIYYVFNGYHLIETLKMAGPLTESLSLVHVGYQRTNPGIHWKYYAPALNYKSEATFEWSFTDATGCSLSCAGGRRKRTSICSRVESAEDKTRVSNKFCDFDKRPAATVPCNTQKCPPVWLTVEWGTCSKRCGTGIQTRNVTCTQKVSASETNDVPDVMCKDSKPAVTQNCNVLDCVPTWVVGDWTACTKVCGGGNQDRTVTCKQVMKNGVSQSSDKCVTDGKPPTQQQCNTKPC